MDSYFPHNPTTLNYSTTILTIVITTIVFFLLRHCSDDYSLKENMTTRTIRSRSNQNRFGLYISSFCGTIALGILVWQYINMYE